jgi:hypothetical protein
VRDRQEAVLSRSVEDGLEVSRRVSHFGRVQSDRYNPVPKRQRSAEGLHSCLRAEVPQETHDQLRGDTKLPFGVEKGTVYTRDHGLERYPSVGVGLRVEEDLDVAYGLLRDLSQIGPG